MHTTIIRILATILACLAPLVTIAQSAPSASEPYSITITPNAACGSPGVGKVWSGARRGTIEAREGKPGYRVDAAGWWAVGCTMPPPPRDCEARPAPAWIDNGRLCQPVRGREIPARDAPFGHRVGTDPALRNVGEQHWRCERVDGVAAWRAVRAWCKPR